MNQQEFDKILERRLTITRDTLTAKGKEYKEVGKRDRLHNFNRGAEMEKTTRERYLRSLWLKHLVLLFDIIDDWQEEKVTTEIIGEKIGDSIAYLVLLEAMLKEDIERCVDRSQWSKEEIIAIMKSDKLPSPYDKISDKITDIGALFRPDIAVVKEPNHAIALDPNSPSRGKFLV